MPLLFFNNKGNSALSVLKTLSSDRVFSFNKKWFIMAYFVQLGEIQLLWFLEILVEAENFLLL